MTELRITARYAEALFDLAQARESLAGQAVAALRAEMEHLVVLVEETPQLSALLERPDLPAEWKLEALREALGASFSKTIMALLAVLVRHRRGDSVARVAEAYGELADEMAGVVRAEARTVVPLTEAQRARLIAALQRLTGRQVKLEVRSDPALLAGVRVQVGDRLIDGSAAGRLARMREELIGEPGSNR